MDSRDTPCASQSERDTSVPCCLYLSEDSNALDSISVGVVRAVRARGGVGMHWQPLNTLIDTISNRQGR